MSVKSLFVAMAAWVITTPLLAERPDTKSGTFNVMSWNIRYANPKDGGNAWQHRKDWVAEIIRREKVDILGLQEVLLHQMNDLKKRLPEMQAYGVGRDDGKTRGEFAAVFFRRDRFELIDKSTFWLSQTPEKVASKDWDAALTRIASWVKLKDRRNGNIFYVVNTHFDHRGKVARTNSAALLVKQLRNQFAEYPVVLTGDFNARTNSQPYKTLVGTKQTKGRIYRDAFTRSVSKPIGPRSTWNGFRAIIPNMRIDYVFVTDSVKVLQHRILEDRRKGKFPSDHLPVLTKVKLGKTSK